MKNIIIIALLAFCACNEIQQLPKNHTAVETFKKKKVELKLDDSYPDSWRKNVIEGDKRDPLYPKKNRFYKLSFIDKNGELRITKHCFECIDHGSQVTVNIFSGWRCAKFYRNVFNNITLPPIDKYLWMKNSQAIMDSRYKDSGFLTGGQMYYPIKCDFLIYSKNKMTMVTPEMEKELNAKEINLTEN